jgi:hypothetical protein
MKNISRFSEPTPLTEIWIEEHKNHSLSWLEHTVWSDDKRIGTRFKEGRCFICGAVAREPLGEVHREAVPAYKEKRIRKRVGENWKWSVVHKDGCI